MSARFPLGAAVALLWAAGCVSSPPGDVLEEDEIRSLKSEMHGSLEFKTAVHLLADRPPEGGASGGWAYPMDWSELDRDFSGTIRRFGVFRDIVDLELGPESPEEKVLETARKGQADLVVLLRPVKTEVRYEGRDALLWGLDLLLWTFLWFPAYVIPDKEFASELGLEMRVLDAPSGREIYSRTYTGVATEGFDDFSKGFGFLDVWSPLLADLTIGESNGLKAGRVLMPHALFQVKRDLLRDLAVDFQTALQNPAVRNRITPKTRRFFAVVVGAEAPLGVKRARSQFARADAEAFWKKVSSMQAPALDPEGSRLLVGADASAKAVLDALEAVKTRYPRPDEDVLFYFSGVGAVGQGAKGPEPVLVTAGTNPKDVERTGLPVSALLAKLAEAGAGRVVVIVDAGFSRRAGARSLGASPNAKGDPVYPKAPPGIAREGVIILAGQAGKSVLEIGELGHGLLTGYLLEALDGKADRDGDGRVTLREAAAYVQENLPAVSEQVGGVQTPWMHLGSPDREIVTPEPKAPPAPKAPEKPAEGTAPGKEPGAGEPGKPAEGTPPGKPAGEPGSDSKAPGGSSEGEKAGG